MVTGFNIDTMESPKELDDPHLLEAVHRDIGVPPEILSRYTTRISEALKQSYLIDRNLIDDRRGVTLLDQFQLEHHEAQEHPDHMPAYRRQILEAGPRGEIQSYCRMLDNERAEKCTAIPDFSNN